MTASRSRALLNIGVACMEYSNSNEKESNDLFCILFNKNIDEMIS